MPPHTMIVRRGRVVLGAVLTMATAACADDPTGPVGVETSAVHVAANLTGTAAQTLVIEVTASSIPTPLVFNLTINPQTNVASGTIALPVGKGRTITVRAYDVEGLLTHDGSVTVDVRPGQNPPINLALVPRPGQQPITVAFSTLVVTIAPASAEVFAGETVQLSATIRRADGTAVTGAVTWATSNPAFALVDASGLVTGKLEGPVTVTAAYEGVAGSTAINVKAGDFMALSVGGDHACGIDRANKAFCWGRNGSGQLGDGSLSNRSAPAAVAASIAFSSISAGTRHTCGIDAAGVAKCWGPNFFGVLGDGTTHSTIVNLKPSPVDVSTSLTFKAIAAGGDHTCAIASDDKAYCWGRNDAGQLGDGTNTDRSTPTAVSTTLAFKALDAGQNHSCGIASDDTVHCWGLNSGGQIGDGSKSNRNTPVPVTSTLTFQGISAGFGETCGLATNGQAYCWGSDTGAPLGITAGESLIPAAVATSLTFTAVTASIRHRCAVATDGQGHCWGDNTIGQLGDGTLATWKHSPVAIASTRGFASVGAGLFFACGLATGGRALCWGSNFYGQLGDGTTTNRLTPVVVTKP